MGHVQLRRCGSLEELWSGRFLAANEKGKPQLERGPLSGTFTGRANVSAVLSDDGSNEEEAESRSFDFDLVVGRGTIKASEDALEFSRKQTEAGVGDGENQPGVTLDSQPASDVNVVQRVFDGVVKEIKDGCTEIVGVSEDEETDAAGNILKDDCG